MEDLLNTETVSQYVPVVVEGAVNVLLAILILIVGIYIANKVNVFIRRTGENYENL